MKKILVLGFAILLAACSSKKEGNMIVNGQIKGLKKGTLYLQKIENDTILKTIDSISVLGSDQFALTANVEEPEMYYLTFDGNTTNKYITFFALFNVNGSEFEVKKMKGKSYSSLIF